MLRLSQNLKKAYRWCNCSTFFFSSTSVTTSSGTFTTGFANENNPHPPIFVAQVPNTQVSVNQYIIVKATIDQQEKDPFWLAKVLEVYPDPNDSYHGKVKVQWYRHPKTSEYG